MGLDGAKAAIASLGSRLGRLTTRQWVVAYGALAVAYLIYSVHQPLSMNAYAGHDDFYFVDDARTILAGDWLGDFNQLTLIKGPGFTYFLVINHELGLPLTLTLALVYLAACACLCAVLGRLVRLGPLATFCLFLLLLLQPAVVPNRVIRDALYHSLFLFVVAGLASVALDDRPRGRFARAGLAGLALGWFWITREEGPWIVPAAALLLAVQAWRHRRARAALLRLVAGVAVMVLAASIPVLATSAVNKDRYGTFTVTDMASGPYKSAVAELDRIEVGPELPRIPVSKKALAAAYRVSPAARELEPFFDGPGGQNWGVPTCQTYPQDCGEIAGGWFGWALRDAAASAGHYRTGLQANRFFDNLAHQIAHACDRGALRCRTNPIPFLPVLTRDTVLDLPGAVVRAARFTTYEQPQPPSIPSVGPAEALNQTDDLLGHPLLSPAEEHGFAAASLSHWLALKTDLTRVYGVLMPLLLVAGGIALLLAIGLRWRGRPVQPDALLLAAVLWVLYVSRLGLIALVDVTAAPAVNTQYLETAFLALAVAGFLSIHALGTARRQASVAGSRGSDAAAEDDHATERHPSGQPATAGTE